MSEERHNVQRQIPIGEVVQGISCILIALYLYLMARRYSPYMGLGEMLVKSAQDTLLNESSYIMALIFAAILGLAGILQLILTFTNTNLGMRRQ